MRSLLVLLSISLCASVADAQACPPRPADFVPHVQLYPGDTLIERDRFSFSVLLMPEHCWTARGVRIPARAAEMRVVAIDGPSRGIPLPLRARGERFEVTIPAPGTHTLRVESTAHPSLQAATVRVHRADPRSASRVRLQLEPAQPGVRRTARPALSIVGPAQTTLWRFGASFDRGRTTPPIVLDAGTYTVVANAPFEQRATFTVSAREAAPVRVAFNGATVLVRTDYTPSEHHHLRVAVRSEDGSVHRARMAFPSTLVGMDIPPGHAQISVESTASGESFDEANRRDDWTVLHQESIEITPRATHHEHWSLAGLLAGQGIMQRPWFERTTFEGVSRRTPTGDVEPQWRGFEAIGDSLVILGQQLAQRQGTQWSALTMPTGWPTLTGPARFAARSAESFAWIEQGMSVRFRSPAGITAETIDLSSLVGPESRCTLTGIAARPAYELVAVGRCESALGPGARGLERGFIVWRDPAQWSPLRESFAPLTDIASQREGSIAVGADGSIITLQGSIVRRSLQPGRSFIRIRAGETRVAVEDHDHALYEWDPRTQRLRALSSAVGAPPDTRASNRFCFVGDTLVALVRQPRERVTRVFVDAGRGLAPLTLRASSAIDLACGANAAFVMTESDEHEHSIERIAIAPAR